jgi:hypothetical protein
MWEPGNYIKEIRNYLILHHNTSLETWRKNTPRQQGGIRKGVAIILSPEFAKAYAQANNPKPIHPEDDSPYAGRFIGAQLSFPSFNHRGKLIKNKPTKLFISSIYHPWETEQYDDFNDTVTNLLANNVTNNTITIAGHDLNACVGTRNTVNDESVHNILGPFGLNNRNEKGEMALAFLQQMNLKVMTRV